jgi:uncharacterized protein YjbJ (UPF0337 family)
MDKDRIEGAEKGIIGKVKEVAGKVLGDAKLESEGKADKAAGKVQNAVSGSPRGNNRTVGLSGTVARSPILRLLPARTGKSASNLPRRVIEGTSSANSRVSKCDGI